MKDLENDLRFFSNSDLEYEIARREREAQLIKDSVPNMLIPMDFVPVINTCQECIEHIAKHRRDLKDSEHWVYESAMEAVYGHDIWKYINEAIE